MKCIESDNCLREAIGDGELCAIHARQAAPRPRIWYLAHPVGAPDAAGVAANLARAGRWLTWLRRSEPNAIISAPWLATLLVGSDDDSDPKQRARGLYDNTAIAARYGSIVLCGGWVSSGMQQEVNAVLAARGLVADLTSLGDEPTDEASHRIADRFSHDDEPGTPLRFGVAMWSSRP